MPTTAYPTRLGTAPPTTFGSIVSRVPYAGPLYNIGGSIYHLFNGTLGQNGTSPSLAGRITQWLGIGNQPVAGWRQNASTQIPSAAIPHTASGGLPPVVSNNPLASVPPATLYNYLRPTFSATSQQQSFPGSGIGPFQGPSIPYQYTRGAAGLGTPNSVDPSIPGWASAFSSFINSRNQP